MKVQCSNCKQKFEKEELIEKTKSKRLCIECDKKMGMEAQDYKDLIDYICKGFGIEKPSGQQLKSIKKFKDLGYTYKEIQYVIYYIFSIENKKVVGTSIELVPFYYEKAMENLRLQENARRTVINAARTVRVVKSGFNQMPKLKNTRLINIEELF